jgi:hypothetical protein
MNYNPHRILTNRLAGLVPGTSVTLRLTSGTDLTGTATLSSEHTVVTLTTSAPAVVWTVPCTNIIAVGA